MPIVRSIFIYILILFQFYAYGQDTIPPILIKSAQDTFFECGKVTQLNDKLSDWFNNAGGAQFDDNSGSYDIITNITLAQATSILKNSTGTLCGNTQRVEVIFSAIDAAGNISLPDTAAFYTIDTSPPTFNTVPNVQYSCHTYIRDTLILWIKNKAGYIAYDLCSNTLQWTSFTYGFFVDNIQISSGSGNIEKGPYPMIPNDLCEWKLKINFFVNDECKNQSITPGTTSFSVTDDIAPIFPDFPIDATVDCSNVPPAKTPKVLDGCTKNIIPTLTESTTQSSDSNSCSHYNYTISRSWTAEDACGNTTQKTQTITVTDDISPAISKIEDITISCDIFDRNKDSIFTVFTDNCSDISISFRDSIISTGCSDIFRRIYTANDICGNTTTYRQKIEVKQNRKPTIVKPAQNIALSCDDQENLDGRLFEWVNQMGESKATAICGNILSFPALKGSYSLSDPSTFPGIRPTTLPSLVCPSALNGWLRYVEVDFVYYDNCGNTAVTSGIFGLQDTLAPTIISCSNDMQTLLTADCQPKIKVQTPVVSEDCVPTSPTVTQKIITELTSEAPPGPEAIIDPVTVKIGPFNPYLSYPSDDGIVNIKLVNMDIDDATEYFNIYDEDGQFIRTTPIGPSQCSSISFDIVLNKERMQDWIKDGYIDLRFEPNIIQGEPVFAVNNICGLSTIEIILSYDVDITNGVRTFYQVNQKDTIPYFNTDSLDVVLQQGINTIDFIIIDCANNVAKCSKTIEVKDNLPPTIQCPSNFTTTLSSGLCKDTISLPINFTTIENCDGNRLYNQNAPGSDEAALISYSFNQTKDVYEARNKQFVFNNVFPVQFIAQPVLLEVEFFGDNNEIGEVFEIFATDGTLIGSTSIVSGESCTKKSITSFSINHSLFNSWISNKQVTFLAVPLNGGDGINPCEELNNNVTIDGISYIRANLKYSDVSFTYAVSGATTISNQKIPNDILNLELVLNGGKNTINIMTKDNAGNPGSCSFDIEVIDIEPPLALCKNAAITIHPSGLVNTIITPDLIDNGSIDNCGDLQLSVNPSELDCSYLGSNVSVTLTVMDAQGNESQCESIVKVNPFPLTPTYSSGLCSSDTLKLFANIPNSSIPGTYTFKWQGPQNTEFFTENPVIPNPDDQFNGNYTLTVTGFNGCTAVGSVLVNIKPLTNPEITTPSASICSGTELVLSGTVYSGDVSYDWYEGIFPTGVLLNSTKNPELIITPATEGPHFYYMIARNPDCSSNPSPLLKVTVEEVPVATVKDLFLSPCEGGEIVLVSSTFNPKYTYEWNGPRGYTANGANPAAIKDINLDHAGNYLLIVKNGSCISDTAITRVNIFESPASPVITGLDIFCEGNLFTLVATLSPGAEKYEWYKNGVLFTTTQENNLIIPNAQTSLQGEWTVKAFKGNCSSPISKIKLVGIDAVLQIGVINTGPACSGDSISLQATFVPNATYMWSGPVSNIPNTYNPSIPGIPGDYSVTITTPTGCKNNANTTVTIISVPEITALSSDAQPCQKSGSTITFQPSVFPNSNQYKYEWSGTNNYTSYIKNASISNVTYQDTGIYTLIVYNDICPSQPFEIDVRFNLIPDIPVISSPATICEHETINILASETISGATYEWTTPLGTIITDTSALILNNVGSINSGNYTVKIHISGCTSDESTIMKLNVIKRPSSPVIDFNSSPICYGDSIRLSASHIDGATYHWTGPDNLVFTGSNWDIPNSTKLNSGVYTVVSEVNGCYSLPSPVVDLTVKDEIKIPAFSESEIAICSMDNTSLEICLQSNSLTPNATYIISNVANQNIISQGNNACQSFSNFDGLEPGTHFLNVKAALDGCFSQLSDNLVLNINVPPDIQATAVEKRLTACPDESIRLISKYGPPQVNIKWTANRPNIIIDDITAISPLIYNLTPGYSTIYLDYSVNGCPEFSRDTVTIYTEFKPVTENDTYHIQYGKTQLLNILSNDIVPIGSNLSILTQPVFGSVQISGNQIEYIADPKSINPVSFTYRVCADFCDNLCSEATVFITFDDQIECFAPTIFTPNDDGINDYFIVPCLETGRFPDNRVTIFNEWGVEVFSARQYRNDWAGTYGDSTLPVGTYFYIIELTPNSKPINGFLILQR